MVNVYGNRLQKMGSAELRLELAEAEYEKPKSWRASALKKDRIQLVLNELVKRGAY
jgi:hypothetical protein